MWYTLWYIVVRSHSTNAKAGACNKQTDTKYFLTSNVRIIVVTWRMEADFAILKAVNGRF